MRPAGTVPQWATDALYPAGSNAWNGQATKVDPGTSNKAGGFLPAKRYPAQFFNWLWNKWAAHVAAYDAFPVQNWSDPRTLSVINIANDMFWSEVEQRIWVVGTNSVNSRAEYSVDGGITWTDNGGLGGTKISAADINPATGFWVGVESTTTNLYSHNAATNTFGTVVMAACTECKCVRYNPYDTLAKWFAIGGKDNAGHPQVWRTADNIGAPTAQTLTNAATYTGTVDRMVHGKNRTLAFATVTAPVASIRVWDIAWNGGGAWTDRGVNVTTGGSVVKGCAYSDAEDLFMQVHDTGRVFVSSDGITWTDKGLITNITFSGPLECYGSIWIAAAKYGVNAVRCLAYSVDNGTTWTTTAQTLDKTKDPTNLRLLKGRFGICIDTKVALSFRAV